MNTKKDYIRAAKLVYASYHRIPIAEAFADFFTGDNPLFDRAQFLDACSNGNICARSNTKPRKVL